MSEQNAVAERQTVFIVDDDDAIREGLSNLLEAVGIASETFPSAEDFLRQWDPARPGCLVLDARLPGMTGVEFQEKLNSSATQIPIIFMTAHGDVPMVRRVMKAGAIEFLTKPFDEQALLDAINEGIGRDRIRRREAASLAALRKLHATLTSGEQEVMELVARGLLNKQIAARLDVSEITVKVRRGQVMRKMNARSLAELVNFAGRLAT